MMVDSAEKAPILTKQERELRKRFVDFYLQDFDEFEACIRLGYAEAYARQFSIKFMQEPYTANLIAEKRAEMNVHTEQDVHRRRVLGMLYKEGTNRYGTSAARVSAAATIAKITGLEAPIKTQEVLPKVGDIDLSALSEEELAVLEKILSKADAASKPN